jgi:hypothetical protein
VIDEPKIIDPRTSDTLVPCPACETCPCCKGANMVSIEKRTRWVMGERPEVTDVERNT